jgi:hypothetical protein
MDEASLEAMAQRVAAHQDAPSGLPPQAELARILASCEERLGLITHHVIVGNLPERAVREMGRQVETAAVSACSALRQTLSEMDFILSSVGVGKDSMRRPVSGGGDPC